MARHGPRKLDGPRRKGIRQDELQEGPQIPHGRRRPCQGMPRLGARGIHGKEVLSLFLDELRRSEWQAARNLAEEASRIKGSRYDPCQYNGQRNLRFFMRSASPLDRMQGLSRSARRTPASPLRVRDLLWTYAGGSGCSTTRLNSCVLCLVVDASERRLW